MPKKSPTNGSDFDNPEWSADDFATARHGEDIAPDIRALFPASDKTVDDTKTVAVPIPLSPEVVEHFKAKGDDWPARINDALLDVIER